MIVSKTRSLFIVGAVFLTLGLSGCQNDSEQSSAAQRTLDELQNKYDELLKDKVDVPVDWATDDLSNIGDWEYRVVGLSYTSPDDLESQLNEYGTERWEVIWLEQAPDGFSSCLEEAVY